MHFNMLDPGLEKPLPVLQKTAFCVEIFHVHLGVKVEFGMPVMPEQKTHEAPPQPLAPMGIQNGDAFQLYFAAHLASTRTTGGRPVKAALSSPSVSISTGTF